MPQKNGTEWITTTQAAEITGYSSAYFRQLILKGRLPAQKWGRDWFLVKQDVLDFKALMDRLGNLKHNPWREELVDSGHGRGAQASEITVS